MPLVILLKTKNSLDDFDFSYLEWPGNLLNLNLMENAWKLVKCQLRGMDVFSNCKISSVIIKQVWEGFDFFILYKLALSMPRRLKECIRRKDNQMKF